MHWAFIVFLLVLINTRAFANDFTAELATGGLVLLKTDSIEMKSEDLFVSTNEIRVHYRFVNNSARDIVTQVAFPMPDITIDNSDANQQKYCLDRAFVNAASVQQSKSPSGYFTEQRLEYVLTTGANWSNPIGEFRLVIDKGAPDNLVSLCGSGIKKISPTQLEMRARDFNPTENLHVLILKRELPEPSPSADRSDAIEQRSDLAAIRRGDYKCSDLWYIRNNLFKLAGYCFKTAQAIRTFGNGGCAYDSQDNVPLSAQQRSLLREIQAAERTKGCPR